MPGVYSLVMNALHLLVVTVLAVIVSCSLLWGLCEGFFVIIRVNSWTGFSAVVI